MSDSEDAKILQLTPVSLTAPNVRPEDWIERFTQVYGIKFNYKTNSITENGEPIEAGLLISKMRLFCYENDLGDIRKMLPDAYLVWRREQARKYIRWLREEIKFKACKIDLVAEWVKAATSERNEIDIAVMRHWIWQCKRKLYGLPVEHHMLVALYGASGAGKSVAVQKLVGPMVEVTSFRDMRIFNDQFARRAFNRSYIMFFDELGRSQDADVNSLKDVISASIIDWRGIGSETLHSAPQNSTFIGCTNLPLRERIHDSTSSRRFWELKCAQVLDWEKINSIDYLALWRSVDENSACPIIPVLKEIRARQEKEIQFKDRIQWWLNESCVPSEFGSESPTTEDLYNGFSEWCRAQSMNDFEGVQQFARGLQLRITQLGWSARSKHSNRGTIWSLKANVEEIPKKPIGIGARISEAVSEPEIISISGESHERTDSD